MPKQYHRAPKAEFKIQNIMALNIRYFARSLYISYILTPLTINVASMNECIFHSMIFDMYLNKRNKR